MERNSGRDRSHLAEYRAKRDLEASGEPAGGRRRAGPARFVVQRHAASRLHFDFRLQIGDVLVSWAVPKGPSLDPRVKRLAVRTEDHPLDYAEFEGRIPEGEYGAGTVIVWDAGTYRNRTAKRGEAVATADALEHGHLAVELDGEKLTGGFTLSRMGDGRDWLLAKTDDEGADRRRRPATTQLASVLTGRTNRDLEAP